MFDPERFVEECRGTGNPVENQAAIREVLARAVGDPAAMLKGLGEPERAGVTKLHHSADLTILNVVWGPYITIMPHNHQMWAVIGVYTGREDNIFWRRLPDDSNGHVEAAGAKALCSKDCEPLGKNVIHSVTNPIPRLTGALHIYGGDFFDEPRSEWDSESLLELPYDLEKNLRLFEESNTRMAAS